MTLPCETCGRPVVDSERYVFAMPGQPISVGLCGDCFAQDAYPLRIVEAVLEMVGGKHRAAEYFLEFSTWRGGQYVKVRDL